jgi:phytanoyl-CoA hydroxylase
LEAGYDPVGKPLEEVDLKVRKYMNFSKRHDTLKKFVSAGHRIHGVVESLIGANPLLFQEMALVKPPLIGTEKPWHQDNAYFSVDPLDSIIGVWIALDDAKVENGCMHVLPGGHHQGALRHFHSTDCEIMEGRLDLTKVEAVPVPAGGALFFYGLLPHETPANRSPERRRALQFHYRSAASRIVDQETYNRIFAEADGTPASCKAAAPQKS